MLDIQDKFSLAKDDNKGHVYPVKPSVYDVQKRFGAALIFASALMLRGDIKHSDDGRESGRGTQLDYDKYDEHYSLEKSGRHVTQYLDPDSTDYDKETGIVHLAANLWHALNAMQAYCNKKSYSVDDVIDMHVVWVSKETYEQLTGNKAPF